MNDIKVITVCVDYHDILSMTLPVTASMFDSILIVTSKKDIQTQQLVDKFDNVECHATDVFYENECAFNKGAAIEESFDVAGREGWFLILDADIVLPSNIGIPEDRDTNTIYGVGRKQLFNIKDYESGVYADHTSWTMLRSIKDPDKAPGFFQLFHASSTSLCDKPWYPTDWRHAGGCDSFFERKWPTHKRKKLSSFEVLHIGPLGLNWYGRVSKYLNGSIPDDIGRKVTGMKSMLNQRKDTGKKYISERIGVDEKPSED